MLDLQQKFTTGSVWQVCTRIAITTLSFGTNIVLARLLAPDDFGTFFLALSLVELIYIFGGWNLSMAVIQAKEVNKSFLDTAYWLSASLGAIFFLIVLTLSFIIKPYYSPEVIKISVILSAIRIPVLLSAIYRATVERELGYKNISLVQLFGRGVPMLAAIGFAVLGFGVWTFIFRSILEACLLFVGMQYISPWQVRWNFRILDAKKLLRWGSQMFVAQGFETFIHRFPRFIIGSTVGTAKLGHYRQADRLAELGHRLGGPINTVSLAAYSRIQDAEEWRSKALNKINYLLIRLSVLVALFFLFFGEQLVVFLYGEKWKLAGEVLRVFSLYALFITLGNNLKHFLYSQGQLFKVIKMRGFQSVFLILSLLILPYYGIKGVALMMGLGYMLGTFLGSRYVKQYVDVNFKRLIAPPILIAGFLAIFYLLMRNVIIPHAFKGYLFIPGAFGIAGIYLALLYIFEREQLKPLVRALLQTIRNQGESDE